MPNFRWRKYTCLDLSPGNGSEDSDLDLFVLTTRSVTYRDKAAMSDAIFEINLQYGVVIHLLITSMDEWKSPVWSQLPVYQDIRREGSPLTKGFPGEVRTGKETAALF